MAGSVGVGYHCDVIGSEVDIEVEWVTASEFTGS